MVGEITQLSPFVQVAVQPVLVEPLHPPHTQLLWSCWRGQQFCAAQKETLQVCPTGEYCFTQFPYHTKSPISAGFTEEVGHKWRVTVWRPPHLVSCWWSTSLLLLLLLNNLPGMEGKLRIALFNCQGVKSVNLTSRISWAGPHLGPSGDVAVPKWGSQIGQSS